MDNNYKQEYNKKNYKRFFADLKVDEFKEIELLRTKLNKSRRDIILLGYDELKKIKKN